MDGILSSVQEFGPTLIYLAMITGVWLAITAICVPGTGAPEVIGTICLVAATAGMILLQANLLGVLLLFAALLCLLAPLYYRHLQLPLTLAGLVLQIIGGVLLFSGEARISLWIIAIAILSAAAYDRFIL